MKKSFTEVSESLPEGGKDVLAVFSDGSMTVCYYGTSRNPDAFEPNQTLWRNGDYVYKNGYVVAWMELPEYKTKDYES